MYTAYEQQHSFYLFYPGATILDNKMSVQVHITIYTTESALTTLYNKTIMLC